MGDKIKILVLALFSVAAITGCIGDKEDTQVDTTTTTATAPTTTSTAVSTTTVSTTTTLEDDYGS